MDSAGAWISAFVWGIGTALGVANFPIVLALACIGALSAQSRADVNTVRKVVGAFFSTVVFAIAFSQIAIVLVDIWFGIGEKITPAAPAIAFAFAFFNFEIKDRLRKIIKNTKITFGGSSE
jgi:hypothetical protein